jgi:LPXTG-motif cell wall-anchored protein
VSRVSRMAAASALIVAAVLAPGAALADEIEGSGGVLVTVEIDPIRCAVDCGGGVLPTTGADYPALFVWLALVLVAAGTALLIGRRVRASQSGSRDAPGVAPYYVLSGRHADDAAEGLPFTDAAVPSRGDAPGRSRRAR